MNGHGIQLRPAQPADIDAIVRVHLAAFPGFFLSRLGPGFLRHLYGTFVSDRDGICLVAQHAPEGFATGQIAGFVAGSSTPAALFRRALRTRGLLFACSATGALIRHPVLVGRRLLAAIWYRGDAPPQTSSGALLSSLAVLPELRHLGIGKQLVCAFCAAARASNAKSVYLTTDEQNNEAVNRFYLSLGFNVSATATRQDGRIMNTYMKSI